MDKKKLLLVAASAGMFLVIVMGAAILVFTPRVSPIPQTRALGTPREAELPAAAPPSAETPVPPGWVPAPAAPALPPAAYDTPPPPAGRDPYGYPQAGYQGYPYNAPPPDYTQPARADERAGTVINVPSPVNAGVPQTPAYLDARAPARGAGVKQAALPEQARVKPQPAVVKTTPVAVKPASAKPPQSAGPGYWVQTGSYERKSSADNAKSYLSTKGINSIVLNSNVSGKTYYRVRVGPYISQNEADYWLSLIKSIDGMENSQVWKSGKL